MGHHQLDKLDEKILKMIAEDARIPFLEVARECNVSGAAIHQRIQKLHNLGIIKVILFYAGLCWTFILFIVNTIPIAVRDRATIEFNDSCYFGTGI